MRSHRTHFLRLDGDRRRLLGDRLQSYDSASERLGRILFVRFYALLQNLNFFVFGILVIIFAIGLRQGLPASRAIATPLGLFGFMFFLLGVFPNEPIPWPAAAHYLISWAGGVSLLFSQFFAWRRLRRPVAGEGGSSIRYGRFSLVTLVLTVVSSAVFATFGQQGSPIMGLLQRVLIALLLVWIELMALRLLQLSKA